MTIPALEGATESPDALALGRIRTDFETNFVVEASAGAGKTRALVERILHLVVQRGTPLSRVAALTFTEKAAAEMKERLRASLTAKRAAAHQSVRGAAPLSSGARPDAPLMSGARPDAPLMSGAPPLAVAPEAPEILARVERALEDLEQATVCTLHAFCGDILRAHPFEAGFDPTFRVVDEEEARAIFDDCFATWFNEVIENLERYEGVARILRRKSKEHSDRRGTRALLLGAGWSLAQVRDFQGEWLSPTRERGAELEALVAAASWVDDVLAGGADRESWLGKSLLAIAEVRATAARWVASGDLDGAEEELRGALRGKRAGHFRWVGGPRTFASVDGQALSKDSVIAKRDAWKERARDFVARADAELASLLRRDLAPLLASYTDALRGAAKVDFLELLLGARRVIQQHPAARASVAARFDAFLVDEFQDTDPVQAELLLLLASATSSPGPAEAVDPWTAVPGPGRLFVVGDPKQSIYRFRRADPALYTRFVAHLLAVGGEKLTLAGTHRFRPQLARFVDGSFAGIFGEQYTHLEPRRPLVENPMPTVVGLPVPAPFSTLSGKPSNWAIEQSFPDVVGAYVAWLLRESGYKVPGSRGAPPRPIAERDICLLFKRMASYGEDVTRPYVNALDARGILHAATGPRGFFAREEVRHLLLALRAIEDPMDTFTVFAVLRGPLFGVTDEELLIAHDELPLDARVLAMLGAEGPAPTEAATPVVSGVALLVRLHHARNVRPFAETLDDLLEALGARISLAFRPAAEQALANVERLAAIVRREDDLSSRGAGPRELGTVGFRGFVERLELVAERGGAEEGRISEEGGAGVSLLSVHRAKGAEFPVVILCDPTASLVFEEPTFCVDGAPEDGGKPRWMVPIAGLSPWALHERREELLHLDRSEAHRLLYVACTRARELLVVPVGPDGMIDGWTSPLGPGLLVPPGQRARPEPFVPAGNPFGDHPFAVPSHEDRGDPRERLRPGLFHVGGTTPVVIWDPNVLPLRGTRPNAPGGPPNSHGGPAPGGPPNSNGVRHAELLAPPSMPPAEPHQAGRRIVPAEPHQAGRRVVPAEPPFAAFEARNRDVANALGHGAFLPATALAKGAAPAKGDPSKGAAVDVLNVRGGDLPKTAPSGPRLGNLVHQLLQYTPTWTALEPSLPQLAEALRGRLSATVEERESALARVRAALEHPFFEGVRTSTEVRREQTVVLPEPPPVGPFLPGEPRGYGVVDLAFRDGEGRWVLVDYKTDAGPLSDERLATYRDQLRVYLAAFDGTASGGASAVLLLV